MKFSSWKEGVLTTITPMIAKTNAIQMALDVFSFNSLTAKILPMIGVIKVIAVASFSGTFDIPVYNSKVEQENRRFLIKFGFKVVLSKKLNFIFIMNGIKNNTIMVCLMHKTSVVGS